MPTNTGTMLVSVYCDVLAGSGILLCLLCLLGFNRLKLLYFVNKQWLSSTAAVVRHIRTTFSPFLYLIRGADMIHDEYLRSNGQPFVIHTPGKKNVMVTSQKHIEEINNAPNYVLSLHAVAKDFLQPKHTMNGFVWKDQRGLEGVGFVRAIRTLLTQRLPELIPGLRASIEESFRDQIRTFEKTDGYYKVPVLKVAEKLVTKCNAMVFFGAELSNNPTFLKVALSFPKDCFLAAEILRLFPQPIATFMSWCATRRYRASTIMHDYLLEIVKARMSQKELSGREKASDGIQWLIDTSPKRANWTAERLVGEIMAIWYGSVHTLSIATSYAVLDLYSHAEYIEPLREEVCGPEFEQFQRTSQGLPLVDSFLRESARLSAFESSNVLLHRYTRPASESYIAGVRRQALQPFTLSGGMTITTGDWICVPHRSMMRTETYFKDALKFDAFRWVQKPTETHTTTWKGNLTDSSDSWLVWGAGRILCPGRFYAAVILKLVVAHLITEYDISLPEISDSRSMQWRSAIIPKPTVSILVKPKQAFAYGAFQR